MCLHVFNLLAKRDAIVIAESTNFLPFNYQWLLRYVITPESNNFDHFPMQYKPIREHSTHKELNSH